MTPSNTEVDPHMTPVGILLWYEKLKLIKGKYVQSKVWNKKKIQLENHRNELILFKRRDIH